MKAIKTLLRKPVYRTLAFALIGAALGFAYYRYCGCTNGTCPLTSKWYIASAYGAVVGFVASRI